MKAEQTRLDQFLGGSSGAVLCLMQLAFVFMSADFVAVHAIDGLAIMAAFELVTTLLLSRVLSTQARAKGWSGAMGILALASLAGYFIVKLLPDRSDQERGFEVITGTSESR